MQKFRDEAIQIDVILLGKHLRLTESRLLAENLSADKTTGVVKRGGKNAKFWAVFWPSAF